MLTTRKTKQFSIASLLSDDETTYSNAHTQKPSSGLFSFFGFGKTLQTSITVKKILNEKNGNLIQFEYQSGYDANSSLKRIAQFSQSSLELAMANPITLDQDKKGVVVSHVSITNVAHQSRNISELIGNIFCGWRFLTTSAKMVFDHNNQLEKIQITEEVDGLTRILFTGKDLANQEKLKETLAAEMKSEAPRRQFDF